MVTGPSRAGSVLAPGQTTICRYPGQKACSKGGGNLARQRSEKRWRGPRSSGKGRGEMEKPDRPLPCPKCYGVGARDCPRCNGSGLK